MIQHLNKVLLSIIFSVLIFSPVQSFATEAAAPIIKGAVQSSIQESRQGTINNILEKQKERIKEEQRLRKGEEICQFAKQFIGNRYVWGGNSLTNGVDCSGFTQQVFLHFDIYLPRTSRDQGHGGISISENEMLPGDLIFYGGRGRISHVALYCGDGQIVHAAGRKSGIKMARYDFKAPICIKRYW